MSKIEKLLNKGVQLPAPQSVEIGAEVDVDRISGQGVVIHSGCKIYGSSTLILQGAKLGYEAPVTVENCHIGPDVSLKGGFFKSAVFLKKASMGLGAHVREGTILEEEASAAHTVALKQTILLPFVTLGSLINFCDCLMSGGTSQKDHSEVGSSYIHFNYTPNQDKATPSLIGDVPAGVMLNRRPIFLGGQGGLVGPCRLAFGTVIGAGSICRRDEFRPDRLILEGPKTGNFPFTPIYMGVKRIVANNVTYIANLMALMQWYTHVRSAFLSDELPDALLEGLKEKLNMAIEERVKRLKALYHEKQTGLLSENWPQVEAVFRTHPHEWETGARDAFLACIHASIKRNGKDYIAVIKGLASQDAEMGTRWLQGIVDKVTSGALSNHP